MDAASSDFKPEARERRQRRRFAGAAAILRLVLSEPGVKGRRMRRAWAKGPGPVQLCGVLGAIVLFSGLAKPSALAGLHSILLVAGASLLLTGLHLALRLVHRSVRRNQPDHRLDDIGERLERRIERLQDVHWELSENLARYRSLLDTQNDAILRRDGDGKLTYVNQAFARLFGGSAETWVGQSFRPVVLETVGGEPLNTDADVRRRRYAQRLDTGNGERWIEWEEHIVTAADGHGLEVQAVGRDVTEARRQEAALSEARDQAESANRAKSRFLAAMSHEIRTPMNGILGMSGLLSDTRLDPEQTTYVRAIDQSARTLLALINEILDFSKIEAGKLVLHRAPFLLEHCIQDAVELLAPRAQGKGLEIAWTIAPNLPRVLLGDLTRLRQILLNLLSNAVKFTDRGGVKVTVSSGAARDLREDEVVLRIEVTDTGIGLSAEDMKGLFGEFEQAEAAQRRQTGGTGLGLAISKRLARAMGGDVTVTSTVGQGSVFVVELRLSAVTVDAGDEGADEEPLCLPRNVLLAFASGIERQGIAEQLRAARISVHECDLTAAAQMAESCARAGQPIDRLIVDVSASPAVAGKALAAVRSHSANPDEVGGVVLVSVLSRASLSEFRQHGFETYLVKPVRPVSILRQLSMPMRARREPVVLPVAREASPQGPARRTRRRVLLAEDNEINALLARRLIERSGGEVHWVRNGNEAVAAIAAVLSGELAAFDIVLMDIFMPELDGLQAAERIRVLYEQADGKQTVPPIVALTANAFAEDRQRYLDAGMDDYLAKPFDKLDLERVLARHERSATTLTAQPRPAA